MRIRRLIEQMMRDRVLRRRLLCSLGYHLYDGDVPADARVALATASWNTIALPEELALRG